MTMKKQRTYYPEDVLKYGPVDAMILGVIKFWILYHYKKKDYFYNGHYWTGHLSAEDISEQTGLPVKTIYRHLNKLVKNGVIIKGNFNKLGMDRTGWYTIIKDKKQSLPSTQNEELPSTQNGEHHLPNLGSTIPVRHTVKQEPREAIEKNIENNTSKDTSMENFENWLTINLPEWRAVCLKYPNEEIESILYYLINRSKIKSENRDRVSDKLSIFLKQNNIIK